MDNRELAAQISKELTAEYLKKYAIDVPTMLKSYQEIFDTVLQCLEGSKGDLEINVKYVD